MKLPTIGIEQILVGVAIAIFPLSGCRGGVTEPAYIVATGGSAYSGKQIIHQYGCGSCHTIPGVRGARGMVGPPLISFGRRTFIAGHVPNSPDNLIRWIMGPQSIDAGTAMPALGLNEQQARDIAAFLYTLE
ncbi:MAG TPA: c-type cytochrome [Blastocatellia bacterium]